MGTPADMTLTPEIPALAGLDSGALHLNGKFQFKLTSFCGSRSILSHRACAPLVTDPSTNCQRRGRLCSFRQMTSCSIGQSDKSANCFFSFFVLFLICRSRSSPTEADQRTACVLSDVVSVIPALRQTDRYPSSGCFSTKAIRKTSRSSSSLCELACRTDWNFSSLPQFIWEGGREF